ncbi:MAG: hypothetical protein ACKOZT_07015 [Cyanobium sp.]
MLVPRRASRHEYAESPQSWIDRNAALRNSASFLMFSGVAMLAARRHHSSLGESLLKIFSWALFISALTYILYSLAVYGLGVPFSDHGFTHSLRMHPPFADLRYLTANSECGVDLDAYYRGLVVGCDPAGRTYRFDYPPMSIWLGRLLHVAGRHTAVIAVSIAISFLVVVLRLLHAMLGMGWRFRLLASALLVGYPTQAAMERGNLDLLLFLLMLLLAAVLGLAAQPCKSSVWAQSMSFALIFLSVSLKIYPLFGVLGLIAQSRRRRGAQARLIGDGALARTIMIAASLAGLLATSSYLFTVGNLIKEGGLNSHGLMALGYMNMPLIKAFGIDRARTVIRLLLGAKFISLVTGFVASWFLDLNRASLSLADSANPQSRPSGFLDMALMLLSSIWLGCYLTTINYDYRFVYLYPFLGLLVWTAGSAVAGRLQRAWSNLIVGATIVVLFTPLLQVGYTPIGMLLVRFVEPLTEFILIPLVAGSLLAFLAARCWILPQQLLQARSS